MTMNMLGHRLGLLAEHGARTLDLGVGFWVCTKCGTAGPDNAARVVAGIRYSDVRTVTDVARYVANSIKGTKTQCAKCGASVRPQHLDFHAHHSGEGKDLVVRWQFGRGLLRRMTKTLHWWDPETGEFEPADELTKEQEQRFGRDALLRVAQGVIELAGYEEAVSDLRNALDKLPGDPELMVFIPGLIQAGGTGLATAILDAHIEAHPDDAEAYFHRADALIQIVVHGALPLERLPGAEEDLRKSLALKPDYEQAEVALCNIKRTAGDIEGARAGFAKVLEKYPKSGLARFNVAILDLENDPESSLKRFAEAEALYPDDSDYSIGCARALVKLGRNDEAREALARAKALNPEHYRIEELEAVLG